MRFHLPPPDHGVMDPPPALYTIRINGHLTLSDPAAADFGVTLSEPTPGRAPGALDETMALLVAGRLRLRTHTSMPMRQAAEAHRQLESGTVHQRIILTLP
jgi:NADPH:quinone reductase-like Zn-dependent oxidoreductase